MSRPDWQFDFLDDPAALAPLKKADDPRLGHLTGRRELRVLKEIMERLSRKAVHGNRLLESHHVLVLHLLGFYNPMMRSLRTFELASQNQHVQEMVGLERICRSTHSDFLAMVDGELLVPVVQALREKIPASARWRGDEDFDTMLDSLVAFDGSYFDVPVTVAWAMQIHYPDSKKKPLLPASGRTKVADRQYRKSMAQIRLNLHWATRRGVPMGVSIDGAKGSESEAFIKALEPDLIYVIDRGIFSFHCLEELHRHHSHYVARLKANIPLTTHQERPMTAEDAAHGVVSDRTGYFTGSPRHPAPRLLVREILIVNPAHPDRPIRLITDLMEYPAHIIGLLYQQRWQIELFFRWLKVHNHFDHLVTHSREGMHFVFYVMMIALLLHTLLHGRPPSKYDVLCYQIAFQCGGMDPGMLPALQAMTLCQPGISYAKNYPTTTSHTRIFRTVLR